MEASLQSIDDESSDPVALVGFTRKGDPAKRRRLYEDRKSATYVEIGVADIVDPPSETEDLERGQQVIWVRPEARVDLIEYPVLILMHRPPWPRRR